ncbi:MAG: adenylosuccinate lyase, partial [Fusobacteriaceae bacterium]
IRIHSMEAGKRVKIEGEENDLLERILEDEYFNLDKDKLMNIIDPKNFIGFASEQTDEFLEMEVKPILEKYKEFLGMETELKV